MLVATLWVQCGMEKISYLLCLILLHSVDLQVVKDEEYYLCFFSFSFGAHFSDLKARYRLLPCLL